MTKAAGVLPNGRRWMDEHGPNRGPEDTQVREIMDRSGCLHRMRNALPDPAIRLHQCGSLKK
jgi:hypothetical protein